MTTLARLLVITGVLSWACMILAGYLIFRDWLREVRKRRQRLREIQKDARDIRERPIFPAEWVDTQAARRRTL